MRVTNHMIMNNASVNINGTKISVNDTNNQMTTQKRISKPSDDPVVAIRSLRFATSLSKINQYYEKNIPDAQSWLDVTESALTNMKGLITDFRTQCVNGATGTLTEDDRNTILKQLQSLQEQIYMEGNADYAGRTVFTGFKTDQNLVFTENENDTSYSIDENFDVTEDMEEFRYYTGDVVVPKTKTEVLDATNVPSDTAVESYYRLRTAYNKLDSIESMSYSYGNPVTEESFDFTSIVGAETDITDANGQIVGSKGSISGSSGTAVTVYSSERAWAEDMGEKKVGDNEIVIIRDSGQIIFGNDLASTLKSEKAAISTSYSKTGFEKGQLKPEYYFDCIDKTDPNADNHIKYKKFNDDGTEIGYDIDFTIAANQTLTVNQEASDSIDNRIQRDMGEMINATQRAIDAHKKIDTIKGMMDEVQYQGEDTQESLKKWLAAAQKEADYADDNLQKLFSTELGKADDYLEDITLSLTRIGCTSDQLNMTASRMEIQKETVETLQSKNDDVDLSTIIIEYTAAYTAYQASLQAASKLGSMTLLNYLS